MEQTQILERPAAGKRASQGAMPGMLMHQALDALHMRRWEEAATLASAVLRERPGLPLALPVLGMAQHPRGDLSALAPRDAQFHYHHALALAERGQPELAMVEYRACLDLSPDFRDAPWNHGEIPGLARGFGCNFTAGGHVNPAF